MLEHKTLVGFVSAFDKNLIQLALVQNVIDFPRSFFREV